MIDGRSTLTIGLRHDLEILLARDHRGATATSTPPLLGRLAPRQQDPVRPAREAAEAAIFPAEVNGGIAGFRDWRRNLEEQNAQHHAGSRVALKMATGSGKTVVMVMLIAWQSLKQDRRRTWQRPLRGLLGEAQILVTNYARSCSRRRGDQRRYPHKPSDPLAGRKNDPFKATEDAMMSRMLPGWGVVFR
jgi:type III restriction enzyme